jgi:transposase-like protein
MTITTATAKSFLSTRRPRIPEELEQRILAAIKAGGSVRKTAAKFGVDPSTVQRIKRPFDASVAA